jgi:CRP-like cAMP-binding protein
MDPARLHRLPLFEDLGRRDLDRLSRWIDDVDVSAGRHIVDQGSIAWEFFVIAEGKAEVLRDGAHVADLGPGDFFGEMALVEHERRSASVVATTPLRLGVMLERDFVEMEKEMPAVAAAIRRAVEERRPERPATR